MYVRTVALHYCFHYSKIKFISLHRRVISSIYYNIMPTVLYYMYGFEYLGKVIWYKYGKKHTQTAKQRVPAGYLAKKRRARP